MLRRQQEAMEKHQAESQKANQEIALHLERTARLVNLVLPPGWLPLGVMNATSLLLYLPVGDYHLSVILDGFTTANANLGLAVVTCPGMIVVARSQVLIPGHMAEAMLRMCAQHGTSPSIIQEASALLAALGPD